MRNPVQTGPSFFLKSIHLNKFTLKLIFILALALLFIMNFMLYYEIKNLMRTNQWVVHTEEVIQKVDSFLYEMVDLESHQRAYLITGDEQFLKEEYSDRSDLKKALAQLIDLTKDNLEQNNRVRSMTDLANQRIDILSKTIDLKKDNQLHTSDGLRQFNRGQGLSEQIKGLGQEIKSVEFVLLNERNNAAINGAKTTRYILFIGSTFSLLSLLLAFILVNIELDARQKVELKNKKNQIRLHGIIESATDMMAAFDKEHQFLIFNQPYQNEFKHLFHQSIMAGMSLDEALNDVPKDKRNLARAWKDSLSGNETCRVLEIKEEGKTTVYEMLISLIKSDENEIEGSVHIIRDISKRVQQHSELQQSYESLAQGMQKLQNKNHQINLLVEMSDMILACNSQEELSHVMAKYSSRMLNFACGYLYDMHPSKNYLEIITSWGKATPQPTTMRPEECWAIRRGRIHQANTANDELVCSHAVISEQPELILCVPLMAQNDIYGMLYLEIPLEEEEAMEEHKLLINAFAELTALALANLRLKENLRHQSIRDPLTGLYNRRYLEDYLFKHIQLAEREDHPISILMIDLDHFKKLNDTFGHDAGDTALKEIGKILQNSVRISDLASRYGGEEFIIILYNTDAVNAKKRAEHICNSASMIHFKHGAQEVGPISLSIGIAQFPIDGKNMSTLIENADQALYYAKKHGRNRVELFSVITQYSEINEVPSTKN